MLRVEEQEMKLRIYEAPFVLLQALPQKSYDAPAIERLLEWTNTVSRTTLALLSMH
jgi:hypothetical protein